MENSSLFIYSRLSRCCQFHFMECNLGEIVFCPLPFHGFHLSCMLLFRETQIPSGHGLDEKKLLRRDLIATSSSEHSVTSNMEKSTKICKMSGVSTMWRYLTQSISPIIRLFINLLESGILFIFPFHILISYNYIVY